MEYDLAALELIAKRFHREMWDAVPEDAVVESGVEARAFGPVQAIAFTELAEMPRMNVIEGAAEAGAVSGGYLGRAVAWMRSREVDYRVHLANGRPETEAAEQWLTDSGFERREDWVKMIRDCSPLHRNVAPEIEVIELLPAEGEGMDSIAADGLGLPFLAGLLFYDLPRLPSWRCYVALLDGEIAACGSMLVQGEVAELGLDATLAEVRGRGCNLALLRRRIDDARRAGCRLLLADLGECRPGTSGAIRSNLAQAGFVEAYGNQCWRRPGFTESELELELVSRQL